MIKDWLDGWSKAVLKRMAGWKGRVRKGVKGVGNVVGVSGSLETVDCSSWFTELKRVS